MKIYSFIFILNGHELFLQLKKLQDLAWCFQTKSVEKSALSMVPKGQDV